MSRRTLAAFSLQEVLLATALFSILGTIVAGLLVAQLRISRKVNDRMLWERSQLMLFDRLRADLATTVAGGISPQSTGLAIQPVQEVTGEGTLVFSTSTLIAYRFQMADQRLNRHVWQKTLPVILTSPAVRITPVSWPGLDSTPPVKRERWTGIQSFKVSSEPNTSVSFRLWFELVWLEKDQPVAFRFPLYTRQVP